jgi:hypothetical protein
MLLLLLLLLALLLLLGLRLQAPHLLQQQTPALAPPLLHTSLLLW